MGRIFSCEEPTPQRPDRPKRKWCAPRSYLQLSRMLDQLLERTQQTNQRLEARLPGKALG